MSSSPTVPKAPPLPIRVLIAEDEPLARAWLRELMAEDPELAVVAECRDGKEAVAAIAREEPDLVLLDVQMPEMDGFGVVRAVGTDRMPAVIFVTASGAHAVRAFDVHAVDYVLKPVARERFAEALRRAKEHVRAAADPDAGQAVRQRLAALIAEMSAAVGAPNASAAPAAGVADGKPAGPAPRLAIKVEGRVLFIRPQDVDWAEAMDNYVRLHVGREAYVVRETLTNLERRLPAGAFLRIHRSTIVNVDRIREVQPWFGGEYVVLLTDGRKLTSGRRYRTAIHAFLERAL
jgi:two-component system, LytTR family, response regulator